MTSPAVRSPRDSWQRWGWLMAVVWMVFLVYPVVSLLGSDAAAGWIAAGWTGLVAFAGCYVVGFVTGMRAAWGSPLPLVRRLFWALLVCAALTVPAIGTQALSFVPFVMSYASYGLRGAWHWVATGAGIATVVAVVAARGTWDGHTQILGIVLMIAVVNTVTTWLITRSVEDDRLRVQLAASDERALIARDVHDLLGHTLTAVKLKAELAQRLVRREPDRAESELADIVRLTGEAIAGVRSTVTGLRGQAFGEQLEISRAALASSGVSVSVDGDPSALSPAQALPAGWIIREATTNILRHSAARRVRISVAPGVVAVEDDGVGVQGPVGNGMRGMAERAAAAGALLDIGCGADGGTRVSLTW